MSALDEFQRELTESTDRLLVTAARLTDADVRAPSLLPGWTRGHVLSHLARNADSLVNLLTWARTGVRTPQYPSPEARQAGIEAGAGRPAAEQLADLRESGERLAGAIRDLPTEAWAARVADHPAWYVLVRRLREVEVHHSDLGAGYGWADWPEAYVWRELYETMLAWRQAGSPVSEIVVRERGGDVIQVWSGLGDGPVVEGTAHAVFAWISGRTAGDGLRVREPGSPVAAGVSPPGSGTGGPALPPAPRWPLPAPPGLPAEPPLSWPPRHG